MRALLWLLSVAVAFIIGAWAHYHSVARYGVEVFLSTHDDGTKDAFVHATDERMARGALLAESPIETRA